MTFQLLESILLIGAGGAVGAISRFGIFMMTKNLFKHGVPVGAMTVNIIGSLVVGFLAFLVMHKDFAGHKFFETFLITGFLGGFTTFSAFSMDFLKFVKFGDYQIAMIVLLGNVLFSIIAVFLGFYIAQRWHV